MRQFTKGIGLLDKVWQITKLGRLDRMMHMLKVRSISAWAWLVLWWSYYQTDVHAMWSLQVSTSMGRAYNPASSWRSAIFIKDVYFIVPRSWDCAASGILYTIQLKKDPHRCKLNDSWLEGSSTSFLQHSWGPVVCTRFEHRMSHFKTFMQGLKALSLSCRRCLATSKLSVVFRYKVAPQII